MPKPVLFFPRARTDPAQNEMRTTREGEAGLGLCRLTVKEPRRVGGEKGPRSGMGEGFGGGLPLWAHFGVKQRRRQIPIYYHFHF